MTTTLWQFLAVFFSGWLYIDATYRNLRWQRRLFKSLTLLLLLLLAWSAPQTNIYGSLITLGLLVSILANGLSWLSEEHFLYVIGAFFISHLLYTIAFATQLTWPTLWYFPVVLLLIGTSVLAIVWNQLENLRWPVATYFAITLLMVWVAGERYFSQGNEFSFALFVGALLLLVANVIGLLNRYRYTFRISTALIAACYFIGHFLIVRSLYLS